MDHERGNLPLWITEITQFETACVKMYVYNLTRRLKISAGNTEDALKWPQHPTELKEKCRYNELSSLEKVQHVVRYLGIYQGIKLISQAKLHPLLMSLQPGHAINTKNSLAYSFIFSSLLPSESHILHRNHPHTHTRVPSSWVQWKYILEKKNPLNARNGYVLETFILSFALQY